VGGLDIRVASKRDLGALVAAFGQRMLFTDRIGRTRQGAGELLVGWVDGVPVGNVYLWCEAVEEPELRAAYPGVPLMNHLQVADGRRARGIGTALVRACEDAARRRGHDVLLLGVGVDNPEAARLYGRIGWLDWGRGPIVSRWTEPDGAGGIREATLTIDVMVRSLNAPGVDAWYAWSAAEVARRMAEVDVPWHVAGGWALELWRDDPVPLRTHGDLEIAVPRSAYPVVVEAMRGQGLDVYTVGGRTIRPLRAPAPRSSVHQLWIADRGRYRLDVFGEPGDARTWVFRRDRRIRRRYGEAVARTPAGLPYLRPECVLLYKAAAVPGEDESGKNAADFAAVAPALDDAARGWLGEALTKVHPGHPWLADLAPASR
jgi:GNAT superfamily N-acetyltransferase